MVAIADSIIKDLPSLSVEQLREIRNRIDFLSNPTGTPGDIIITGDRDADLDTVVGVIQDELKDRGFGHLPLSIILKAKTGDDLRRGTKVMMGFVREYFDPSTKVETIKAVKICLRCVVKCFARKPGSLKPATLFAALRNTPAHVDRNFPEYRSSGLLKLLLHRSLGA